MRSGTGAIAGPIRAPRLAAGQFPSEEAADRGGDHVVGFYEHDDFLIDSVVGFLSPALDAGDAAIMIASPAHRHRCEQALARRRYAPGGTPGLSGLVAVDAAQMLARIMVDGSPDPARFRAEVGGIVDRVASPGRTVRVYGDLVALLWERHDVAEAMTLEDLWNELGATRSFALLCGYPMAAFGRDATTATFRGVCDRHDLVIPSESYTALSDPGDRLRAVALLQHETVVVGRERSLLRRERAELEAALVRLRELERLRMQFVAMMVHDIRGPAAVIAASLDLLTDGPADLDDASAGELIDVAVTGAARIERLARDVLTMSRIESGAMTYHLGATRLGRLIDQAVGQAAGATGRTIRRRYEPADLPDVFADAPRQRQILDNLLSNAVKFSPDTSPITVSVANRETHVVVSVRDEGVGIDPADQARLFDPFWRLHSAESGVEGYGLGLFTAKAFVEGQGGRIWVDSEPGEGSNFAYTVPVASG